MKTRTTAAVIAAVVIGTLALLAATGGHSTHTQVAMSSDASKTSLIPPVSERNEQPATPLALTDEPATPSTTALTRTSLIPPVTEINPDTSSATGPPTPCTPGYDPCILDLGSHVDCAGSSGNGPRFVSGPVHVDDSKGDPYGLDPDHDGIGCE